MPNLIPEAIIRSATQSSLRNESRLPVKTAGHLVSHREEDQPYRATSSPFLPTAFANIDWPAAKGDLAVFEKEAREERSPEEEF